MPNHICECGQLIESLPGSGRPRKYCLSCRPRRSDQRRRYVRKTPVLSELQCFVCPNKFLTKCSRAKYCSLKCKERSRYLPGGTYYENPIKCAACGRDTPRFSKSVEGRTRCIACREASKDQAQQRKPKTFTWVCSNCGKQRTRPPTKGQVPKYCSKSCEQKAAFYRRRAQLKNAFIEDVNRLEVFMADGYRCYLCGKKTDPKRCYPHPKSPTVDHVIPLNKGGLHERANCRTACARCNSAKQDRGGGEQFALVL